MAEAEAIHRELIYRHLAYCNALRLSLRKQTSWEELAPFLSEEELGDVTGYANKATRLSFLQGRRLADLFSGGVEQAVLLARMDTTMSRLLDIQGGCERIKHTAFPDEVRFISRAMVWLTAVAIPVAFLSTRNQVHILEIIAVIIISLGFMVVEQLGASLKNPFENLDNDTPMTALCRTIEIDLRQALGETELPRPVEPVNGVLL
jgi:putative membrane protein